MINCYQECSNTLSNLSGATSEWQKIFAEVKANLKKREEARKVHDHYDEKMEKILIRLSNLENEKKNKVYSLWEKIADKIFWIIVAVIFAAVFKYLNFTPPKL